MREFLWREASTLERDALRMERDPNRPVPHRVDDMERDALRMERDLVVSLP